MPGSVGHNDTVTTQNPEKGTCYLEPTWMKTVKINYPKEPTWVKKPLFSPTYFERLKGPAKTSTRAPLPPCLKAANGSCGGRQRF